MTAIPLFNSSLAPYLEAIEEGLTRVARSGRYILGPEVEAFEREFAAYLGVRHCVGVSWNEIWTGAELTRDIAFDSGKRAGLEHYCRLGQDQVRNGP